MSALIIANSLPTELIVLPMEIIDAKDMLLEKASQAQITDADSLRAADAIQKAMVKLWRDVDEKRLSFGRELDSVKAAVKAAADEALAPLAQMRDDLGKRIKTYTDAERARYDAEVAAAKAEQARLQAEEDARAQAAAELAADPEQPASEVFTPEVMPKHVAAAYVPPPPKSSSVRAKPPKPQVDEKLLPLRHGDILLWREPNIAALRALHAAGVKIPGFDMVPDDGIAVKGSR